MSKKEPRRPMYKGLPLVDANKDLEIEIKKGDISSAKSKDPSNCAVAKAAQRVFRTEVEVHVSRVYVKKNDHWVRYRTPERISREITAFDRGAHFEPGEYTFKAPSGGMKLGTIWGSNTKTNKSKRTKSRRITMNIRERAETYTIKK